MKICRTLFFFLLFVVVLRSAPSALAFEVRNGESVSVGHDQVINSSLLVAGKSLVVDGIVHGDVYCAGQNVVISGLVDGDVLCAGQTIRITGVVTGNTRMLGQTIDISGTVRRNVSIVSQTATLAREGSVNGEILFAGQTTALSGLVRRAVSGAGQTAMLNGTVNGDVWFAGQSIVLGDKAVIAGNFTYTSPTQIQVPKTASISGTVTYTQVEKAKFKKNEAVVSAARRGARFGGIFFSILWNIIVAALAVYFLPKVVAKIFEQMKQKPWKVGLRGFLLLIVVPVVGVMLLITIIGIPFAIVLFMLYGLAISFSRIFPALLVGESLVKRFLPKKKESRWWPVVIGVSVSWLVFNIPIIGGFLSFAAVCWGLGGMAKAFRNQKELRISPQTQTATSLGSLRIRNPL